MISERCTAMGRSWLLKSDFTFLRICLATQYPLQVYAVPAVLFLYNCFVLFQVWNCRVTEGHTPAKLASKPVCHTNAIGIDSR